MSNSKEWREFFDGHAPEYMQNVFVKNTQAEIDFVLNILRLQPGAKILDMGCGTGRHSIELAKRGIRITGVDLSKGMLSEAKKAARAAKVSVNWLNADARDFKSRVRFDGAICLCEGAFGLLGKNDDPIWRDIQLLSNIKRTLKPGARFILTALNGLAMIRRYNEINVDKGLFDPLTLVETSRLSWKTARGRQTRTARERGYVATELRLMFELAGFEVEHIWGGTAGDWGHRRLKLDEIEVMLIGRVFMPVKRKTKKRRH
jgi:cyclopropane fatty-acyl-phospholipid synthase-like methyltransferase